MVDGDWNRIERFTTDRREGEQAGAQRRTDQSCHPDHFILTGKIGLSPERSPIFMGKIKWAPGTGTVFIGSRPTNGRENNSMQSSELINPVTRVTKPCVPGQKLLL